MSQSSSACDALSLSSSAAYKTIGTYNQQNPFGINAIPLPSGNTSLGMVVPLIGNITYDALVAPPGLANGGYFTKRGAYGPGAGRCEQQFAHTTCS